MVSHISLFFIRVASAYSRLINYAGSFLHLVRGVLVSGITLLNLADRINTTLLPIALKEIGKMSKQILD